MSYQKYEATEGINQSFLKDIPSGYIRKKEKTNSMRKGSLLDSMITQPDRLDIDYVKYSNQKFPSEEMIKFLKKIKFDGTWKVDDYKDQILSIEGKVFGNIKQESLKIEKIKEYWDYFKYLHEYPDATIITQQEFDDAENLIQHLKNTCNLYNSVFDGNVETQVDLYAIYDDVKIKGLLDVVKKHGDKVIITDIKRTDKPLQQWKNIIRDMQYDFQLSFYRELARIKYNLKIECQILFIHPVSRKCLIVKMTDESMDKIKYGYNKLTGYKYNDTKVVQEEKVWGWAELLNVYKQCNKLGLKDYFLDYYKQKGIFKF